MALGVPARIRPGSVTAALVRFNADADPRGISPSTATAVAKCRSADCLEG